MTSKLCGLQQEVRRSGSFTFAAVSSTGSRPDELAVGRRATSSEPCEVMASPRLGMVSQSPLLRHASSLPPAQVLHAHTCSQ
jgi:hypothetical protein